MGRVQVVRSGLNLNLTLWGEPGTSYALQTSPDLSQWRELSRLRLSEVSQDFTDAVAGTDRTRCYRLVPQ